MGAWLLWGEAVVGASLVPSAAITLLKGRWVLTITGIMGVFPLLWIGSVKLAHPNSWWARRFYGPGKLARARAYQAGWDRNWTP